MTALLLHTLYSLGCAIEDGSAFGTPYTIAAVRLPRIDGSDILFTATYASPCEGGRSEFEAQRFGDESHEDVPAILQQSLVLVVLRHAPVCASPSPFEREVTVEVRAPLPASARGLGTERMLACPPGSTYDMVKLSAIPTAAAAAAGLLGYYPHSAYSSTQPELPSRPADWDEAEDGPWEAAAQEEQEQEQEQEQAAAAAAAAKGGSAGKGGRASFQAGAAPPQDLGEGGGYLRREDARETLSREDEAAATEEEEGARVARELATHSAADSVA